MSGEVLVNWKVVNVVLISKKDKKEGPGNHRPGSLASMPGKITEVILGVLKNT